MLYTFYSYKGGVGRSMALANVGVLLARWGKRILMVDWDLEAPGLYRYFPEVESTLVQGVVDLMQAHADGGSLDWRECTVRPLESAGGELLLIGAGRMDSDYATNAAALDWHRFFEERALGSYLEDLRRDWLAEFDIVLVDSRTGISDIGGVCTVFLPDSVIAVMAPNRQSLEGTIEVAHRAVAARDTLAFERGKLVFVPVLGRDESRQEYALADEWKERIARDFDPFLRDWVPRRISPRQVIDHLAIPHVPRFGFGEILSVLVEDAADPLSMSSAYARLATLIENQLDWPEALA